MGGRTIMKILKEYDYKGYDIEYPKHGGAYGVTVAKGGRVVREFVDEHDAEEWIDEETEQEESLTEDTVKTSDGKWTNKGKEGTHGKFKTKKQADKQRKAMFANGYKAESKETDKLYKAVSDTVDAIDDLCKKDEKSAKKNLDSADDNITDVKGTLKEDLDQEYVGVSSLINDLLQREYEQLSQYDSAQITLEDKQETRFSDIFEYIKDDINIHIGMLQSCLEDLNGSEDLQAEGEQKADELISESLNLDESLFESVGDRDIDFLIGCFPVWGHVDFSNFKDDKLQALCDVLRQCINVPDGEDIEDYIEREYEPDSIEDFARDYVRDRFDEEEMNCGGEITSDLINLSYLVYGSDEVSCM